MINLKKILLAASLMNISNLSLDAAEPAQLSLKLAHMEEMSLQNSPAYQAAMADAKAASYRAASHNGAKYPRLSIEGSYRYITEAPELSFSMPQISVKQKLGDNINYSVGPQLSWLAFDGGASLNTYASARALAKAKELDAENVKRQVLLNCRTLYLQLALAGEQMVLLTDAVELSNTQYDDITKQARAGTKSRMDQLLAHQELLARQRQLSQAHADTASALRELSSLANIPLPESCITVEIRGAGRGHEANPCPTIILELDKLGSMRENFSRFKNNGFWHDMPSLASAKQLIKAAHSALLASNAPFLPRLQLSAKSSIDYPNNTKLESFNQNTLGAALSWPLFDGYTDKNRKNDYRSQELAAQNRREQLLRNLTMDWLKTRDQLDSLERQLLLCAQAADEAKELADIAYRSYRAGALTYLELQNANYRALEADMQLVRIHIQTLLNEAVIASLTSTETQSQISDSK